jgi:two-component system, cell cycle sensor histidine kinase and response regulator CckA
MGELERQIEELTAALHASEERVRVLVERSTLDERARQNERLEAVGQLAGGIAHDFNNVLLVIRGYSSVLRSALDDAQQIADLDEISSAADRATELTRRLLAFSRKQVLTPELLSVVETVRSMHGQLARTLPENVILVTDLGDDVAPVVADAGQIESAIVNLVANARDALELVGGTLTLAVGEVEATGTEHGIEPPLTPGRYVTLAVGDDGPGIADDVLPHIFEPFFTTKHHDLGAGLGLATVYGVVAQSGGGIQVSAADGKGSRFTIYLPAAAGEVAQPASAAARHGGGETILLVEDETPVRELVRRVLENQGYSVVAAGLPSEAERLLDETPQVDLLLTDVVMPEMSGYDLALRVNERRPEIRLLFISGYAPRAQPVKGPLLKKPFAPDELARSVRAALDDVGTLEIA